MTEIQSTSNPRPPLVLAFDPGQTGGYAIVGPADFHGGGRMPVVTRSKRKIVDCSKLDEALSGVPFDRIVIEQVSAMPRQGVTSSFNFGRHTGSIEGWALSQNVPVHWVTPSVWKGRMGLTSDKQASMDMARLEFGPYPVWSVKANDGIAEAALLALYWQRYGGGGRAS